MAVDRDGTKTIRPLTKQEIDERLHGLIAEVAGSVGGASEPNGSEQVPQWITPAELVRRMSRFLVYN